MKSAKRRNIDFNLSMEEYESAISNACYYCQNVIGNPVKCGGGLDRLDNSLGYIPGNVVACCNICNSIKMHIFSPEETKAMVQALIAFRKL